MKLCTTAIAFSFFSAQLLAQEFPTPKPLDAHKILAQESGTWDCHVKMFTGGPNNPPTEHKGTEVNEMINDGLHSRSVFKCQFGDREFRGHGLMGYNPKSKEYIGYWVDNFTMVPSQTKGKYDAEKKTITMFGTVMDEESGAEIKQKTVTTLTNETSKTFEIFMLIEVGGKEQQVKLMEMTATKRKS